MPGRDILVVIDNAATAAHLLAPAAVLARRFDARLTGFFPTGLPSATSFGDLSSGAQLVEAFMTAQREEAVKAEAAYRQELGHLQLAGDWVTREADFGESVTARWVAANRSILRTAIVILGLLVLLTAANPNVRLLVKLAVGVLVALAVIEVLARPAAPKHRRAS